MSLYDVFDDGQAQARPARIPGAASVDSVKTLGQTGQMLWADSRTCILNTENHAILIIARQVHHNSTSRRGVAQCIAGEIEKCA